MKKIFLILILILSFHSWINANEINEFEIEGMSVGESLLVHMDEALIKEAINNEFAYFYEKDFVSISTWSIRDKFEIYDDVGVILDRNDKKYNIYGLEGSLYLEDNEIEKCHKKQKEISTEIQNSLDLNSKGDTYFISENRLAKHIKSIKYIDFDLNNNGVIRVACFEIIKGVQKNSDVNVLYVIANSPLFWKYLDN